MIMTQQFVLLIYYFFEGIYDELLSSVGLNNVTFNKYMLIDKVIDSTGIPFIHFPIANFYPSILGVLDTTGTLKAALSHLMFTHSELANGNFTEITPGLLDVRELKLVYLFDIMTYRIYLRVILSRLPVIF